MDTLHLMGKALSLLKNLGTSLNSSDAEQSLELGLRKYRLSSRTQARKSLC